MKKRRKRKIRETLIGVSIVGAMLAYVAAVSSIGHPDFTRADLPAVIGITAACAGWLSLVAYANRPQKKAPHAGQSKEGAKKIISKTA